jgi:hypothetical protein
MKLRIDRFMDINDGTIGKFYVVGDDGVKIMSGFSLEPAGPDTTTPNKDRRIPQGLYNLDWTPSPKYNGKLMPTLHNELVSKSRRILIHQGNYPIDTEGCILLGDSYDNKGVYNSVKTLAKVFSLIKDKKTVVEINNLEK